MNCTTCPNCGSDLEALHRLTLGELQIDYDGALVHWRGQRVWLNPAQRLVLLALARADGAPVRRMALADATGYEGEDPDNIASVHVTRIKNQFRRIDPAFDQIENVRGVGLRWRVPVDA